MLFPSYSGTLWWYSTKTRIDEIHTFRTIGKSTFVTEEVYRFFSLFWEWNNSGRKGEGQSSTGSLTPLNPFGKEPEEEKPQSDYRVLQKAPYETRWKRNQDAVYWVLLEKRRIKDSNSGKQKHLES